MLQRVHASCGTLPRTLFADLKMSFSVNPKATDATESANMAVPPSACIGATNDRIDRGTPGTRNTVKLNANIPANDAHNP